MPLEPKRRRTLTVVAWNAKVGRRNRVVGDLRRLIRETGADVVLLQEAENYIGLLRTRFPRWRTYAVTRWDESANCPVMVRRKLPRGKRRGKGWGVVRNRKPWTYAKTGVDHLGRTWTWVNVAGIDLMSIHRATGALSHNGDAGAEEANRLRYWLATHEPSLAAGDFNHGSQDKRAEAALNIARSTVSTVVAPIDGGIDYGIARGLAVTATRGGKYGSDHRAVVFTIREK